MNLNLNLRVNQFSPTNFINDIGNDLKGESCVCGIDEAGRGPVLGPLVYTILGANYKQIEELEKMEIKDSKQITPEKREEIYQKLKNTCNWISTILSPNFLNVNMLKRDKYNLNEISHDTIINLVEQCTQITNINELYIDTVGPPETLSNKLKVKFPNIKTIKVEKKADDKYLIVGAASICSKVIRDYLVMNWEFVEGLNHKNFGSGYPSDPLTKQYIKDNLDSFFGFSTFVRFGWSTARVLIDANCINIQWDEPDDSQKSDTTANKENPSLNNKRVKRALKKSNNASNKDNHSILKYFSSNSNINTVKDMNVSSLTYQHIFPNISHNFV